MPPSLVTAGDAQFLLLVFTVVARRKRMVAVIRKALCKT